jgi:dihydroflavonol-4-reductase
MSKILVTGGTGLVGAHLLYFLVKSGESPIAIKRKQSDILNVKTIFSYYSKESDELYKKIHWKECDILDVIQLDGIIKNVKYIYHCAALISFNNSYKDKMIEINTTGTANIVDLALKNKIKRICYVSSIATLGSNNDLAIDEDCFWTWDNKSGYSISKYLAEMEVWRGFAEGLSGFIVNPSLIIGPGSWESGVGTIITKGKLGLPFYPDGSCGLIDVNDLVTIMTKLMDSSITNERFIINAEHMSYHKIMSIVAESFNHKKPYIKLGSTIMKIFIWTDAFIKKIRQKKIELSIDAINYTNSNTILNSDKIKQIISIDYNIEDSLKECIQVFKSR